MNITDITTRAGSRRKRKRVGRGHGSGHGKTSGRGHKGSGARAGYRNPRLSEGGMFPLFRRLPKVGFSNHRFRTEYQIVNLDDLEERFEDGDKVTAAALEEKGLIHDKDDPVKVLGDGEIKKKLTVEAQRFSATAAKKLEASGGTVTRLGPQPKKKFIKRPTPAQEDDNKGKKRSPAGKKRKESSKKDDGQIS